jgi:hypothetical protein
MARCRIAIASLVLALVLALGLPAAAEPAAYPYQVSNTADSGSYTLRSAIEAANATPGVADTIPFAIDDCPAGVCTIVLQSDLPALTDPAGVTINGYTQNYASEAHDNVPASLKIVIDGNGHNCLDLSSANNVIKGLDIRNCNCGVTIQASDASDNVLTGNHIGTGEAN